MKLTLIRANALPILDQLHLEEALTREGDGLYCLINWGAPPAIVLGISGKIEEVNLDEAERLQIPLIRRFSGGGTVVIDEETLLTSLIGPKEALGFPCFPEPLMRWSADLYGEALRLPGFSLRHNDYTLGERKCAGNAQYLTKSRFIHHTSFLFDLNPKHMHCLHMPSRTPPYRAGRSHLDFLSTLKDHFPSKESIASQLRSTLAKRYTLVELPFNEVAALVKPTRLSSHLVDLRGLRGP